jgi:hypothetical protein
MTDQPTEQASSEAIVAALSSVEHPEIAATLVDLGMVRDIQYDEASNTASLILVLPFFGIPQNVRDYMVYSLYQSIKPYGVEFKVGLAEMTEEERQAFFVKEKELWRF